MEQGLRSLEAKKYLDNVDRILDNQEECQRTTIAQFPLWKLALRNGVITEKLIMFALGSGKAAVGVHLAAVILFVHHLLLFAPIRG